MNTARLHIDFKSHFDTAMIDGLLQDLILISNAAGEITYINRTPHEFALPEGYASTGVFSIFDFISKEWNAVTKNILSNAATSHGPVTLEMPIQPKHGSMKYYEVRFVPLYVSGTDSLTMIELRDITKQKIFENKISDLAREHATLIEHANAPIFTTDVRGYIVDWNLKASEVTGFSRNEAYTRRLTDLIIQQSAKEEFGYVMQDVLSGNILTGYELNIRSQDLRELSLLINATPRKNSAGMAVGISFVAQDITELASYRKSLEQKVGEKTIELERSIEKERQALQMKNRFVSMASHEFKTPLSYIHSMVNNLKTRHDSVSPEQLLEKLNEIASQVKHMQVFLEDLVSAGRDEAPKMKARTEQVDIISFLHVISREVENSTGKTHTIRLDVADTAYPISTDPKLLRNIFINLLGNAIKFSPGCRVVCVTVTPNKNAVDVFIRDSGIGIDAAELSVIFQPYGRAKNATNIKGTGLGLSIVKRAVTMLGGSITVDSTPGKGTCFCVTLPSVKE
jgi:PAS domain S-box-containing protein